MKGIQKKLVPTLLAIAMIFSTCFSNLGTIVYADPEQTVTTLEQLSEFPPECSEDEAHCALNLLQQVTNPLSETEEEAVIEEEEPVTEEEEPVTEEEEPVIEEEEAVTEEEEPVTEEEEAVTEEEEAVTEEEELVTEEEEAVTEEEEAVTEEEEAVTEEEEPVTEEEEPVTEEEEAVTEEEEAVTEEEETVTEEEETVTEEEEAVTEEEEALIEDDTNSSNNVYNSNIKFDYNLRSISEYVATGSKAADRSWSDESYNYSALVDYDTSNTYPFFSTSSGTSNPSNNDGRVWVDKSVTLGDNDGEFDIMLSTLAQEYTVDKAVPANVVFILDVSWSMVQSKVAGPNNKMITRGEAAVNALNNAIQTLLRNNPLTKVGVVTFSGDNVNYQYDKNGNYIDRPISPDVWSDVLLTLDNYSATNPPQLTVITKDCVRSCKMISHNPTKDYFVKVNGKETEFYGGTYTQAGIQKGANELITAVQQDQQDKNRLPVLILLSDGKPTYVYGGTGVESGTVGNSTAGNAIENSLKSYIKGEWGYWTIQTARAKKKQIASKYNYSPLFYTVGLGITDPFGKTVLNQSNNNINDLLDSTLSVRDLVQNETETNEDFAKRKTNAIDRNKKLNNLLKAEGNVESYATYGVSGDLSASDLNTIFQQMAANASKIPYSPFAISTDNSAAITFTDVIGEGMEIKGAKEKGTKITVRYGTNNYEFVNDGSGNYKNTTQSVTNDYGSSVSLSRLSIRVTETNGVQTLTWSIPKELVPVYRYVTTNTAGTVIYDPALPIRLIYTVELKSDATNGVNIATYYTNAMTSSKDALTKAEFTLAANNKYYQNNAPATNPKKDSSNNMVNITDTAPYVSSENKSGQSMTVKLGNNGRLDVVKNVSKTVTKSWNDNNYTQRPDKVQVQLKQNGNSYGNLVDLNSTNNWSYTWGKLPKYDGNGKEYIYTVQEVQVDNYISSVSEEDGTFTITNILATERKVTKSWNDNNYTQRPDKVQVQLKQDGNSYGNLVELNSTNNWSYTWEQLPKYAEDGKEYIYTVQEVQVDNYISSVSEKNGIFTITNILATERKVTKSWNDNGYAKRPDKVQVQLKQDGNSYGNLVELNSTNNWSYTWEQLPKYAKDGKEYIYTVQEVQVDNYISSVSEKNGIFTITNTLVMNVDLIKKNTAGKGLPDVEFELYQYDYKTNFWNKIDVKLVTNNNGLASIPRLIVGKYKLVEVKTNTSENKDYQLLDSAIEFDIPYNPEAAKLPNGVAIVDSSINSSSSQLTITVTNYENLKLPDTGGEGVIGYVIGGSCLVGLSAVLYIRQVRRKNVSKN